MTRRITLDLFMILVFLAATAGIIYVAGLSSGGPHSEVVSFTLKPMPTAPQQHHAPAQQSSGDSI